MFKKKNIKNIKLNEFKDIIDAIEVPTLLKKVNFTIINIYYRIQILE